MSGRLVHSCRVAMACARRGLLWMVYQFSPGRYWDWRSRELHETWFANDASYRVIREMLRSVDAKSCLEIGCNGGRYSRHLVKDCARLVCQDVSPKAIALCRTAIPSARLPEVTFHCGTIADLYTDYPQDSFDIVVSNRVLSAVKPRDIGSTITTLTAIARCILINELLPGDRGATYYWFAHDYDRLLGEAGMNCAREVIVGDERFRLYTRDGLATRH